MKTSYWLKPFDALVQEHRRRQAVRDLQALPGYLLDDIGVERADIPDVVADMMNKNQPVSSQPVSSNLKPVVIGEFVPSQA